MQRTDNAQARSLVHYMPPGRSTDGKFQVRFGADDEGLGFATCAFAADEPVSSISAAVPAGRSRRMLRTSRFCLVGEGTASRSCGGARSRGEASSAALGLCGAASCISCGAAGRAVPGSLSGAFAATAASCRSGGAVVATTAGGGGSVATGGGGAMEGITSGWTVWTISARGGGLRQGRTRTAVPRPATSAQAARTVGICRRSGERRDPRDASGPMRSSGPGARGEAEPVPRLGRSHAGRRERVRSAICTIGMETTAAGRRSNASVLCVVEGTVRRPDTGPVRRQAAGARA